MQSVSGGAFQAVGLAGVLMSFSSGMKTAMGEATSWIIAGAIIVGAFIYFDELKAAFSPLQPTEMAAVSNRTASTPSPPQIQAPVSSGGYRVELTAERSGHFKTPAYVNGRAINVLVDTGATYVGLTYEDAERAGIFVTDDDFKYKVQTANGDSRIAIVMIDRLSIGDIEVRDVKATVAKPGKLHVTLLGMSFLGKLRRTEMRQGRLVLEN